MIRKCWAVVLSIVMILTTMPVMVFATDSLDNTLFVPATELKSFNTNNNDGTVSAAKVYFGAKDQQWWIAGSQDDDSIVLFAASALGESMTFNDTMAGSYEYEGKSVSANHYGASQIREKLNGDIIESYFNASERSMLEKSTIYTNDPLDDTVYSIRDLLYLGYADNQDYFTVGENSEKSLSNGLRVDPAYWGSESFWLRTPFEEADSEENPYVACIDNNNVNRHMVTTQMAGRPAVKLDLSSILFASAAPAAISDGALTLADTDGSGAFTLRHTSDRIGTAKISSDKVKVEVSGAESGTYLVVQNSNGAYAKAVSGAQTISASDMNVTTFENCQVWLEKTTDRITYATLATQSTTRTVIKYDLWIGSTQVTSENADDILKDGTVSYDASSNTLTLNNLNLDTNSGASTHTGYSIASVIFADQSIDTLTVHVTGENNINVTQFGMITAGIYAYNDIIFEGDGSLKIGSLSLGQEGNAVYAHTGNVTINSGIYSFEGDGTGSYGIFANSNSGTVYVKGGTLTVSAGETGQNGTAIGGKLDFDTYSDCEITASVNASGTPETTYIPDNQNIYRLYKYIKIEPKSVLVPVYDENGFQTNGDGYQPAEKENGVYQIKNAGNLFWFAQEVKQSGEGTVMNAELIANITIPEGRNWTPISVDKQSTSGVPYTGTFDGKNHTISGLKTEEKHGGLFKSIAETSVVKNLGIVNGSFTGGTSDYVGAIAATNNGTIENCYNTCTVTGQVMFVGGIAGENKGTIKECYNTGPITVNGQGEGAGGICGTARAYAVVENCYNTGSVSGRYGISGICGYFSKWSIDDIQIVNCYNTGDIQIIAGGVEDTFHGIAYSSNVEYDTVVENCYYITDADDQNGGKTESQFASGEITWLLNGKTAGATWGQSIGTDRSPVLKGDTVYAGYEYCYSDSITYSNDAEKVHSTKPEHSFTKLEYDKNFHWYSCANDGCTQTNGKEAHHGGAATYFNRPICEVCAQEYGDLLTDITAPDGEISVGTDHWNTFLNQITFGHFFKDTQAVTLTAHDDSYDVAGYTEDKAATIAYYLYSGDTALTQTELESKEFTPYTESFNINPDNRYVVYAKITDHAGNVTYINSNGLVLDATAPAITGIADGNTYYTTQNVLVTDDNLESVTLNGSPVNDATLTLKGDVDAVHTIVATDKSGNTTTVAVTMKPISDLAESFADLKLENVTSEDKEQIEQLIETVNESLQGDAITSDEESALQDIKEDLEGLLSQIENAAQAGNTENITNVKDITAHNVKIENKKDLVAAKKELENALDSFGGNYTKEEKTSLEDKLAQINSALNSIENAEKVEEAISKLPNTVKPDDTDAEKLIKEAKELYDALSKHEKSLVTEAAKEKLENLLAALRNYQIIKGDGSKWTKGTKTGLEFTANGAYSKFTGIQIDGKTVKDENYTAVSGSTVITLKPEYLGTLSVGKHTLTALYKDGEASCRFEVLAQGDAAAQTGDDSNIGLWITLAAIGALISIAAAFYDRKRKTQ